MGPFAPTDFEAFSTIETRRCCFRPFLLLLQLGWNPSKGYIKRNHEILTTQQYKKQ
jgi:hypothetical protein